MKLIAGLGNPGEKYKNNRHNLGFMMVDAYVHSRGLSWRYSADRTCYLAKSNDFLLIKPISYMNKSGEAVKTVSDFYKIASKDILVVHDDLDFDFGKVRLSFDSSSAGHRGVESVIESLGTVEFARLRIGIGSPREAGRPSDGDAEKYVLSDFSGEEQKELPTVISRCGEAISSYLAEGITATMNRFN